MLFDHKANVEFLEQNLGNAGDVSLGIEIINVKTNQPYTFKEEIKKAAARCKADIIIKFNKTNMIRYVSMKALNGAKPSILNHTPRSAKVFQTILKECIPYIDLLAQEYIQKRKSNAIGEDVPFYKLAAYKDENIKNSFIKTISYFVFTGTGSSISPNECDGILLTNKDGSLKFIDCDIAEKKYIYITSLIDNCTISFRSKGMPKKINDICLPWIYTNEINGTKCGSIHVRL